MAERIENTAAWKGSDMASNLRWQFSLEEAAS